MDDLISRQAAIDAVHKEFDECLVWDESGEVTADEVEKILEELPSVQPEIIRCKDCKWWSNDDYRECSSPNYDGEYVTPAGFYCGWAERRIDEHFDFK